MQHSWSVRCHAISLALALLLALPPVPAGAAPQVAAAAGAPAFAAAVAAAGRAGGRLNIAGYQLEGEPHPDTLELQSFEVGCRLGMGGARDRGGAAGYTGSWPAGDVPAAPPSWSSTCTNALPHTRLTTPTIAPASGLASKCRYRGSVALQLTAPAPAPACNPLLQGAHCRQADVLRAAFGALWVRRQMGCACWALSASTACVCACCS